MGLQGVRKTTDVKISTYFNGRRKKENLIKMSYEFWVNFTSEKPLPRSEEVFVKHLIRWCRIRCRHLTWWMSHNIKSFRNKTMVEILSLTLDQNYSTRDSSHGLWIDYELLTLSFPPFLYPNLLVFELNDTTIWFKLKISLVDTFLELS